MVAVDKDAEFMRWIYKQKNIFYTWENPIKLFLQSLYIQLNDIKIRTLFYRVLFVYEISDYDSCGTDALVKSTGSNLYLIMPPCLSNFVS